MASQRLPMVQRKPKSNVAHTKKSIVRELPQGPAPPVEGPEKKSSWRRCSGKEQNPRSSDPESCWVKLERTISRFSMTSSPQPPRPTQSLQHPPPEERPLWREGAGVIVWSWAPLTLALEGVGAPGVSRGSLEPLSLAGIPTGLSSWNGMFLEWKACPFLHLSPYGVPRGPWGREMGSFQGFLIW